VGAVIDIDRRCFKLSNGFGGLSGPAIRPVALAMVYKAAHSVKVPIIGIGGIMNAGDAIQFLLAGARAVEVGTACFIDPLAPIKIIEGINSYLERYGEGDINAIVGKVRREV
jgi:dihydroorotate dehydrogenase (NAD+) catalytic subunit